MTFRLPRRFLFITAAGLIATLIFAALLALDLANRGLAWDMLYDLTGEEAPFSQARGFVEWLGNTTRQPLNLALDVPVNHAEVSPFGVNTFLEQEVEPAKREQQMQMIADAGFNWIRQQFVWEDIEIHGKGDFVDTRNDPAGVDSWAKYDQIVDLAEQYGIQIQARLSNPPAWAQTAAGDFAPPANAQDYVDFAAAVAERYRGRIHYFQVWNEPNIYPEWGEQSVDPEAFTELLCRTYYALKAVDPEIVVIAPALSPTLALTGRDLSELIYLERMYQAGAGDCFDVLAAQAYGFFSGPTDQRLRIFQPNFARQQFVRDLMVQHGDAQKPIWISEVAWNPLDSPDVPIELINREGFGVVTPEQAARYLTEAYQRVAEDFPYIGVMNYWYFKPASEAEAGQSWYYFRMLEPDFEPMPVYEAFHEYHTNLQPTLYRGVHQAEDWAIESAGDLVEAEGAQFGVALSTHEPIRFMTHGTDVIVRVQSGVIPHIKINGRPAEPISIRSLSGNWTEIVLQKDKLPATNVFQLSMPDGVFLLDSVQINDHLARTRTPIMLGGMAVFMVFIGGVIWALWQRFRG